jgi:ATP-dependent Clp protease ATP-binding subunit ClpC
MVRQQGGKGVFERYTEEARRVLFFSRYEASQLGSLSIQAEHLLLGLIREAQGLTGRYFARSQAPLENIRKEIEGQSRFCEKVGMTVEVPFSAEMKRALQFAGDEADHLLHHHIGPDHLLLGLLRDETSFAASILQRNGFTLAGFRAEVSAAYEAPGEAGPSDRADAAGELEQMKKLVDRLASALSDQEAARDLIEQIWFYLARLEKRFRRP